MQTADKLDQKFMTKKELLIWTNSLLKVLHFLLRPIIQALMILQMALPSATF